MTEPTGPAGADFDESALQRLARFGGGKLVSEMIAIFASHAPERLAAARQAFDAGEADGVRAAFHALKSSSAQLGAARMYHLCVEGESMAREGNLPAVEPVLAALDALCPRSVAWMTERVASLGAAE